MEWLAGAIDYGIIGLLAALSVIVVALGLERYFFYKLFVDVADLLKQMQFTKVAVQTKSR